MAFGAILGSHANFVGPSAPCAPALGKLGRQSPRRPTGDRIVLQPTAVSIGIKLAGLVSLVAIQDAETGEGLFNLIIPIRLKRAGEAAEPYCKTSLASTPRLLLSSFTEY